MSHLTPNVNISNENDKNGDEVVDSRLSMKPDSLQGLNHKKGGKVNIQNTQQTNNTSDMIQPKESESEEPHLATISCGDLSKSKEMESKLSMTQSILIRFRL